MGAVFERQLIRSVRLKDVADLKSDLADSHNQHKL